jgi:hypothetical protein
VSSSSLGFSSNPKFRVLLRKVRCEPLSLFWGLILTAGRLFFLVQIFFV